VAKDDNDDEGEGVGISGFEDIARISVKVNGHSISIYSDSKKEYDRIAGVKETCERCGERVPHGVDECAKCGLTKHVCPAFFSKGVIHIRDGYNISKQYNVMLQNHELGHWVITPRTQLNGLIWFEYVPQKFEMMWKEKNMHPWEGWRPDDVHAIINMMMDSIINHIQVSKPGLNNPSVFGSLYAWKMMQVYKLNKYKGDKLRNLFELHYRLNRAIAQHTLKKDKTAFNISNKEEREKVEDLFYFIIRPREVAEIHSAMFLKTLAGKYGWFAVDRGLRVEKPPVSRPAGAPKIPSLSTDDFIRKCKAEGWSDKRIEKVMEKMKKKVNWV
jgi:hypothetical protein